MRNLRASSRDAVRRLAGRKRLLPATALLLRARTVRPAWRFVVRELLRPSTSTYSVRETGLRVTIRHRTGDVVTLGEVFHERDYEPPTAVRDALVDVRRIVDLGANVGLFGAYAIARWPHAEVHGYEPDPANALIHERTIRANGLEQRWSLTRTAAGARAETVAFKAGEIALSRIASSDEVRTASPRLTDVEQRDVLGEVSGVDLLKVDIEGGEWAIIGDPRFRADPPRVLVLEYHPYLCPAPDARAAAIALLEEAGMTVAPASESSNGHGMLWAWRP